MKILFIAPIPPPITGHSIASKVLFDALEVNHEVMLVNFSKDSFVEGVNGFGRITDILRLLWRIATRKRKADKLYLTISESLAGNIKDIFIYALCFQKRSDTYIHLHGGSIRALLWDKYPLLRYLNKFFIRRFGGVIILGESHKQIFADIISPKKIWVVPNFAQDYLFVNAESIREKFSHLGRINILFMSNMIPLKGYYELAASFLLLSPKIQAQVHIDFAGAFDTVAEMKKFMDLTGGNENITYHGVVDGQKKQDLFAKAHLFCLPTCYLEGQPISILEAYASGCVVLTSLKGGIVDIFETYKNGFKINDRSEMAIAEALLEAFVNKDKWTDIALCNHKYANEKYRVSVYNNTLKKILETK